jgi:hypothetical protein
MWGGTMSRESWNTIVFLLTIIISLVTFYFINLGFTVTHETIHKQIFAHFGVDSTIKYNYSPFADVAGTTTPADNYKSCNETCYLEHTLNEIVTYNINNLVSTLFLFFLLFLAYYHFIKIGESSP